VADSTILDTIRNRIRLYLGDTDVWEGDIDDVATSASSTIDGGASGLSDVEAAGPTTASEAAGTITGDPIPLVEAALTDGNTVAIKLIDPGWGSSG